MDSFTSKYAEPSFQVSGWGGGIVLATILRLCNLSYQRIWTYLLIYGTFSESLVGFFVWGHQFMTIRSWRVGVWGGVLGGWARGELGVF